MAASLIALLGLLAAGPPTPVQAVVGPPSTVLQLNPAADPPGGSCLAPFSSGTGLNGTPQLLHLSLNLGGFANQAVRLRFSFETRDGLYNKFEGWYVNNLSVTDGQVSGPIFSFNGRSDTSGWTAAGSHGTVPGWHITNRRTTDFGSPSWWYGNEATGTYQVQALNPCSDVANDGTLTSPVIALGGASTLTFDTIWQIESVNPASFDLMRVQVIPQGYQPNPHGYSFPNTVDPNATYASMSADYPASQTTWPIIGGQTIRGTIFFEGVFKPLMAGGLCYGFAASSLFYYNDAIPRPRNLWNLFNNLGSNQTLIERYHSRQLAEVGATDATARYIAAAAAGNAGVFNQLASSLAAAPQMVGIVPSKNVVNPIRWAQLFKISHAVAAYDTTTAPGVQRINVYDPNVPGDTTAALTIDAGGGLTLSGRDGPRYGGGIRGDTDYGQPSEWQAVPIPDFTWLDGSQLPIGLKIIDNQHWILDLQGNPLLFTIGAAPGTIPSKPIFLEDAGTGTPVRVEQLPSGGAFSGQLSTSMANAAVGQFSENHVAVATQTDAAAAGSSHSMDVDPAASSLHLYGASSGQQYTLQLGADYLPNYGRQLTLSGVGLAPNTTVDLKTDAGLTSFTLSTSGPAQVVAAMLLQAGQNPGTVTVQAPIPGGGASTSLRVANWNDLARSLIYEVTVVNGQQVVTIIQDNPVQRRALIDSLFAQLATATSAVTDPNLRLGLSTAAQLAQQAFQLGDLATTAAILSGLEIATNGLATLGLIPAATAAAITAPSQQIRGLLGIIPED